MWSQPGMGEIVVRFWCRAGTGGATPTADAHTHSVPEGPSFDEVAIDCCAMVSLLLISLPTSFAVSIYLFVDRIASWSPAPSSSPTPHYATLLLREGGRVPRTSPAKNRTLRVP